jgi:predicted nucleotidyltransferase
MASVFDVADVFVQHAVRKHGGEIGIIAYYGSYATGTATERSDLDLIYTPDDIAATMDLYTSFVLDGRPYEFWPISWRRLERMASAAEHWAVSAGLIASSRVLYHRSEEDLDRFEALRSKVRELQTPERRREMVGRALTDYSAVLNSLGKLRLEARKSHLPGVRWAGWEVVTSSIECLALVNQTYFSRGWGSNHEEVLRLREKPEGLAELMEAITTSDDIGSVLTASEELAHRTRDILLRAQREVSKGETVSTVFRNYYPGIHEYVGKIVSAAEEGRPVAANYAAARIQTECGSMLSRALTGMDHGGFNLYSEYHDVYVVNGFPDLMAPTAPAAFTELVERAGRLDARSRSFLREAGLGLNILEDLDHLKRFLEERSPRG